MPNKRFYERTRQRHRAVLDTGLPVKVLQPANCSDLQQSIIGNLVTVFYDNVSTVVNYDHVRSAVPKSPVPLEFRNHRYDIAVKVDQRVILIDVLNIPLRYWKHGGVKDHVEGQE